MRTLTVDIGRVCAQANGAALLKYGETTVLSTATASDKPRDGVDFFPLSVEFEEKMYSVGKIPGGFNKREGKASENSILTARVIDRPMRPLFPKDYRNDVTLNNMVMSVDPECRPELVAMIGAALSTTISDIPFDGPCAMTQMGMKNGEFIVNPSQKDWDEGDLKLTVASTATKVIMIEAGANEIPEAKMIEAIYKCHDVNQTVIAFINKIREEVGKPKHAYTSCAITEEMFADQHRTRPHGPVGRHASQNRSRESGNHQKKHHHRGQGRSGRLLADPHLGHVNRFNDYVDDLAAFWQQEVQPGPWRKRYILAHSMGGAISTLFLQIYSFPSGVCAILAAQLPD